MLVIQYLTTLSSRRVCNTNVTDLPCLVNCIDVGVTVWWVAQEAYVGYKLDVMSCTGICAQVIEIQ